MTNCKSANQIRRYYYFYLKKKEVIKFDNDTFYFHSAAKYLEPILFNFWIKNKCSPLQVPYCLKHNVKYSHISLANGLEQINQDNINIHLNEYNPLVSVKCYPLLPLFLCSLYTPFCNSTYQPIRPCKSLCKGKLLTFWLIILSWDF